MAATQQKIVGKTPNKFYSTNLVSKSLGIAPSTQKPPTPTLKESKSEVRFHFEDYRGELLRYLAAYKKNKNTPEWVLNIYIEYDNDSFRYEKDLQQFWSNIDWERIFERFAKIMWIHYITQHKKVDPLNVLNILFWKDSEFWDLVVKHGLGPKKTLTGLMLYAKTIYKEELILVSKSETADMRQIQRTSSSSESLLLKFNPYLKKVSTHIAAAATSFNSSFQPSAVSFKRKPKDLSQTGITPTVRNNYFAHLK